MEVTDIKASLFRPIMIIKESAHDQTIVSYSVDSISNSDNWYQDACGLCYIPDLVKIEVTFDGDINDPLCFDEENATVFSIISTKPEFMDSDDPVTDKQHHLIVGNIINCFSGELMALPHSLQIGNELSDLEWSYRIVGNCKILPCVVDGQLAFEAI